MFKKRIRLFLTFGFVLCFLSAAWGGGEPIRIGVPSTITGPYAGDGLICKQSVEFAVDDINSRGGVLNRLLKVYYYDVADCVPEKVMASAEDLVNRKKVNLVLTSWIDFGVDVKAYGKFDVPYLSVCPSTLSYEAYKENPEKYWNYFNYGPPEIYYAIQSWPQMMQLPYDYPNKKVFVINMDDFWADTIKQSYIKMAKESGWEIVGDETVSVGNVEYGTIITKINATKPAIIFSADISTSSCAAFVNQFAKRPTNSLIQIPYTPSLPDFKDMTGKNGNGVFWNLMFAMNPGAKSDVFMKKFIERYGEEHWSNAVPPAIWDMFHHWKEAVEAVGKVDDYRAIANYLETHSYEGLSGKFVFPKETHTADGGTLDSFLYQIQDGEDVVIFPKKFAGGSFKSPHWIK